MTERAPEPAEPIEPADPAGSADPTDSAKTPVWWTAVPVLVVAYAVYGLLQGDTGSIWPWGDIVLLVVALTLLGAVLAPRLRSRR